MITPLRPWSDRTVLVTGGAGYLGSRLVRDLGTDPRFRGVRIRILDNLQRATHTALADLPSEAAYEFVEADVMDSASTRLALRGVDAVVHLAALVQTPFSFDHPTWTEHVNHWGTAHLLEACLEEGVSRLVFASSASVYGPGGPFAETDDCRPVGPYSQSKFRGEQAVLAASGRGLSATVLRLGTLYGWAPAARFDAVPNRLAYRAAIGQPITVHGSGDQVRAVLHVADASDAVRLCLMDEGATSGGTFNAASANPTIAEVAATAARVWPAAEVRRTDQHVLAHFSLSVDATRLRQTGWRPTRSLEQGFTELRDRFGTFQATASDARSWAEE